MDHTVSQCQISRLAGTILRAPSCSGARAVFAHHLAPVRAGAFSIAIERTSPILELLPPPASRECRHRGLARRFVSVRRGAVLVVAESALIGSASAAIECFANSVGNDTRPSAALRLS